MFKARRGPLLIHTLSLELARKHYPCVELVTDRLGLAVSDTLGWQYTTYYSPLDALCARGIEHVWAAGKLVAMLAQEEPFIQIDVDVCLLKPIGHRLATARMFAQSMDYPGHYQSANMLKAIGIAGLPGDHVAYNAGILGGSDLKALHQYATDALELAKRFSGNGLNGTSTSMCIEQYSLGVFSRRHKVRVDTLISMHPTPDELDEVGYIHLTGAAKLQPHYIERCESQLRDEFPAAYKRFLAGWGKLENSCPVETPTPSFHSGAF